MFRRVAMLLSAAALVSSCAFLNERPGVPRPSASVPASVAQTAPGGGSTASAATASPIDGVKTIPDLGKDHVPGSLTYDANPPAGGPHNAQWLACDVYDAPVPREFAVHSLEHGAVWLAHRPGVEPAPLTALREKSEKTREYVLVSPEEDLPAPVVAVAWGLTLEVDSPGDPRLQEFVSTYAGGAQGGEPGVPCAEGGVSAAEAADVLAQQRASA